MKRMVVLLGMVAVMAAIVALTAGAAVAQAQTETWHNRGQFSHEVENPCTGETIVFEGRYHNVVHVTLNENGYHTQSRASVTDATGTGLQTGDRYRFINAGGFTQYSEIEDDVGGLFISNDEIMFLVVSEGASPNFLMHVLYKVTLDADGQPDTQFVAETIGCTPEVETSRPPLQ